MTEQEPVKQPIRYSKWCKICGKAFTPQKPTEICAYCEAVEVVVYSK